MGRARGVRACGREEGFAAAAASYFFPAAGKSNPKTPFKGDASAKVSPLKIPPGCPEGPAGPFGHPGVGDRRTAQKLRSRHREPPTEWRPLKADYSTASGSRIRNATAALLPAPVRGESREGRREPPLSGVFLFPLSLHKQRKGAPGGSPARPSQGQKRNGPARGPRPQARTPPEARPRRGETSPAGGLRGHAPPDISPKSQEKPPCPMASRYGRSCRS